MPFTKIQETCLYVADLARSRAFYEDQLGLEVISEVPGRHLFLRVGASVLLCFIADVARQATEVPPHFGAGQLHVAFETSKAEYPVWKEKIRAAGIAIEHEHDWGRGYQSFYFRDPDQHCLEVVMAGMWG